MKSRLAYLWSHHRYLFLAFALALAVTLFFAIRTVVFIVYWSDPAHRNQPLEPWMTPRYVANSYDVPVEFVAEYLGITTQPSLRPTLDRLAREKGVPVETLMRNLAAAIQAHKASSP